MGNPPLADAITLPGGRGHEFAQRTRRLARRCKPIEPVFFFGLTHDPLRIDRRSAPVGIEPRVLALSLDIGQANLDRIQFVGAYSPDQELVMTGE
jgi:hypothetical protein